MKKQFLIAFVLCAAFSTCLAVGSASAEMVDADQPEADKGTIAIYWENDGTVLKRNHGRDRHYTNGLAITFSHQPDWADDIAPHMPFADDFIFPRTGGGYILSQRIFTPEDTHLDAAIPDDRPYAGYLYGGIYWQREAPDHWFDARTMDHFQFDLGVIGKSSQADEVQKGIHDFVDIDDPEGWDNQISDEPTIQLTIRKAWRFDAGSFTLGDDASDPLFEMQVIPHLSAAAGTIQRHIEGGVMFRFGVHLPDDYGPGEMLAPRAAYQRVHEPFSLYGFVAASGQVVEFNALLEGSAFDSGDPGVDIEHLIGQVRLGIAFEHRPAENWQLGVAYWQSFLSQVFEKQHGGNAYGSLAFHATYTF